MKIDLIYPKIPENSNKFLGKCWAFEKLDGTNMHWIWTMADGWHLFGTRRTQFKLSKEAIDEFNKIHPELANAAPVFNDKYRDKLTTLLSRTKNWCHQHWTIFTEFYGPNSFAGAHDAEDARTNAQTLTIIDLAINKLMFSPEQLIEDFEKGGIEIARLVYCGKYSGQFSEDIRDGKYPVNEGVVVKGIVDDTLFMTKIKTKDYLKRLQKR